MPQQKPVDDWQDVNDWQDVSPSVPFGGRKPPAGVQKFPTKELFGTMWGTDDSILPPIKGITRPILPEISPAAFERTGNVSGNPLMGSSPELNKWLYENVARPSSSAIGAASDWATGKALSAVAKPIVSGASNLLKRFKGAGEAFPPIRNVEAPVAELPPVKPELLDDSGRMVAPPQSDLPVRPNGPWNENLAELPPVKPDSPLAIPNRAPQIPEQPPVSAKYVFDQPTPEGGTIPMYNIEGGPLHGTTVSAQTLDDLGLPVPEKTAPMQKPLTLEERQTTQAESTATKPKVPTLYHGTRANFDTFDTTGGSGWGFSKKFNLFSENPEYTSLYSLGEYDGLKRNIPFDSTGARTIPVKSNPNNILDLTKPLTLEEKSIIEKAAIKRGDNRPVTDENALSIARSIHDDLPYDAIRFSEHGQNNWAIRQGVELETPTGISLTKPKDFDPSSLGFEGAAKPGFEVGSTVKVGGNNAKPGTHGLWDKGGDVEDAVILEQLPNGNYKVKMSQGGMEMELHPSFVYNPKLFDVANRSPRKPLLKMGDVVGEGEPLGAAKPSTWDNLDNNTKRTFTKAALSPEDINRMDPEDIDTIYMHLLGWTDSGRTPFYGAPQVTRERVAAAFEKYGIPQLDANPIDDLSKGGISLDTTDPSHMQVLKQNLDDAVANKPPVGMDAPRPFDEAEFVNPTTGEIVPESLAGQGDVPLNAPPIVPSVAGRSATKRMGSPDLGLTGVPNAAEMPPIQQPTPETLNTNALSRPAQIPDEPWTPVGSLPNNQPPLMDVSPQIPFQPAGIPRPPTPYQPAGVPITLGPPKPRPVHLGPEPPPPPIPPTPYQPAGIPKQLGPQPPKQPPMGPRKPPQPPNNPLVPPPPPPPGPIRAALSAHKAWLTSLDLSAPGRQGKAFLFNKAWWTSLDDMGKAWWSKQGADAVNDSIENHASGFFKQTQLLNGRKVQSWAEQMGLELPKHEEMFNNTAGKKFAEMTGIEKSSRAHTAFLNKLRSDQFASMIEASQKAGVDPIRNQNVAKAYAKFINDATGRGSVNFGSWKLERNMQMMNDVFFAPKNMSGQIRTWNNVLNPAKYYSYDPVLRKQALKSLFAVAGVGLGVGEIARMAGAKVSNDPTSADFRKVRLGDTRIDMFGGYQQFPVAAMKLLTGESTSTISGRTTDLTAGRYGQQTRASVAERFFINRLSPVGSFIYAWMANREFDGKPFEVKRALFERTFPIAAKDIWELAQEDPALAAIMAPTTMTGLTGTQHYTGR